VRAILARNNIKYRILDATTARVQADMVKRFGDTAVPRYGDRRCRGRGRGRGADQAALPLTGSCFVSSTHAYQIGLAAHEDRDGNSYRSTPS
jgi:hypothetical protein